MSEQTYICNASFGHDRLSVRTSPDGKDVVFKAGHIEGDRGLDVYLNVDEAHRLIAQLQEFVTEDERIEYEEQFISEYNEGTALIVKHVAFGRLPQFNIRDRGNDSYSVFLTAEDLLSLQDVIELSLEKIAAEVGEDD